MSLHHETVVRNLESLVLMTLAVAFIGCSDNVDEESGVVTELKDAYVIGFDQCARYQGNILAIVNPPDTVITYNLPDTVYHFPDEYYLNYLNDCLFPGEALASYPLKVKFRPSRPEELSAYICFGNIYTERLSPLIKNKQVVIVFIEE